MNKLDLFFAIGRPFSPLYSGLMSVRSSLYKRDILKRHTMPVPVISVGNLTVGGTGKTPAVLALARMLQKEGYHPAVISRGYGGKARGKSNTVSTGKEIRLSVEAAGDEPVMLAKNLPGIPVITGKSRVYPCQHAITSHNSDILLLDDGFQHLAVKRNLDLVLFNATTLAGNSRVLPGGVLREPVKALNRCHAFLLTGMNSTNREQATQFSNLLKSRFPEKPVFFSEIVNYEIWSIDEEKRIADPAIIGKTSAFCAIANPIRFYNSIKTSGINMVLFTPFHDHSTYNQGVLDNLCQEATAAGVKSLVTTEKDFVKIEHLNRTLPLYILKINQKMDSDFFHYVLEAINR
jgi:tetraacyldisaccharide 4'-kinase